MNLTKLFGTQKLLDAAIIKKKGLEGRDTLPEKILALQVELGECANEWRGFKFWSEDRESRGFTPNPDDKCETCDGTGLIKPELGFEEQPFCHDCDGCGVHFHNPLLEEYVDCLHFVLSIGLEHKFDEVYSGLAIESLKSRTITCQFTMLMRTDWEIYDEGDGGYYHEGLELFLSLGEMLGFTWEQIESAYMDKNEVNHSRQNNGY